jgi:hypothetical protein
MLSDKNLIELVQVDGKELAIERQSENCWVNLTEMARPFGKRPKDWLAQLQVQEYLKALADKLSKQGQDSSLGIDDLIIVKYGGRKGEAGTWCTDYRIAMRFAQWLDARFSIEVDTLLVRIANGELIVNDSSLFRLGGEQWVSCNDYCKAFGKSMHSFYGLIGNYPQSFCNWKGQWYMSRQLFGMKEIQARFEDRRTELRSQGDKRQLSIQFPEVEPNEKED